MMYKLKGLSIISKTGGLMNMIDVCDVCHGHFDTETEDYNIIKKDGIELFVCEGCQ